MSPGTTDPGGLEGRVAELETRAAFQERALQELNDAVVRQGRELERLQREVEALRDRLRALAPSPVAPPDEETPPPHY